MRPTAPQPLLAPSLIRLTRPERAALLAMVLLLLLAALLPAMGQSEAYHQFADQRSWLGLPHAADVLTNLVFAAAGGLGLYRLAQRRPAVAGQALAPLTRLALGTFFLGILATSAGSAYYHAWPDSATLLWDRAPMVLAFAGVLGTFTAERISARMGALALGFALLLGAAGLLQAATVGSITAYAVLQFGGLAGMLAALLLARGNPGGLPWRPLLGWYVVAKLLELGDRTVWELTGQLVSGHSLKHLAAGMAALVLWRALAPAGCRPPA